MQLIGTVLKAQGIKGEIKTKFFSDDLSHALSLDELIVGDQKYKVLDARTNGGFVYYLLEGVSDRNCAEALAKKQIFAKLNRKKLKKDSYFVADLIGITISDGHNDLGEVIEVEQFGAADIFVVKKDDKIMRFPFIERLNLRIDIAKKRATVDYEKLLEVCVYED